MTSNVSRLEPRRTEDGSFSLFSHQVGEGFHSGKGAVAEAWSKFVEPADLERWPPGSCLRVLDVCFGTGSNTAALLEAADLGGGAAGADPLVRQLASSGFADTSRIGGGNPELGTLMARCNRDAVREALRSYRNQLEQLEALVDQQQWQELEGRLKRCQALRPEFL